MSGTVGSADLSSVVNQQQLGNQLLAAIAQQLRLGVPLSPTPTSYTVASLPTTAGAGTIAWASNGRKPGEGGGSGTGVPVFWNPATTQWFSFLSGSVVTS